MKVINNTSTHTYTPALPHAPRPPLPGGGPAGWGRGGPRGCSRGWAETREDRGGGVRAGGHASPADGESFATRKPQTPPSRCPELPPGRGAGGSAGHRRCPHPLPGGARVSKARSSRPLLTCPSHSPPGGRFPSGAWSRARGEGSGSERSRRPRGAGRGAAAARPGVRGRQPGGVGELRRRPSTARSCSPAGDSSPPQGRETGPAAPAEACESLDADFQGSRVRSKMLPYSCQRSRVKRSPFYPVKYICGRAI